MDGTRSGTRWRTGAAWRVGSSGGHRRAGEEPGLVPTLVERPALLVEEAALEHQAVDGGGVAVALRLGRGVAVVAAPLAATRRPRARGSGARSRRRATRSARSRGSGPGRETSAWPRARLSSSSPSRIAARAYGGRTPCVVAGPRRRRRPGTARGPTWLRHPVRPERRRAAGRAPPGRAARAAAAPARCGETPRRMSLTGSASARRDHGRRREPGVGAAGRRLAERDHAARPAPIPDSCEICCRYGSRSSGGRLRTTPRAASAKRALPPARLEVVGTGVDVEQVVDDRAGDADLLAPAVGLVAHHLVGVAALGQADDADVVQLHAGVVGGQLADQLLERGRAERARLLAGRVDVVGQRDPLRVPGDQRDLARA